MQKYILPVILIAIAIVGFFVFIEPLYGDIKLKREQVSSYNEALDNSKALEAERDKLTQKYNLFNQEDISKLQKLLPDNIDNIRLILEVEKIATPYGMVLKDVKYDSSAKKDSQPQTTDFSEGGDLLQNKNYGIWDLEFTTQGTYPNFVLFIKDLERNLRIVDVSSIQFSSSENVGLNPSLPEAYKYNFKIKTYWLKN